MKLFNKKLMFVIASCALAFGSVYAQNTAPAKGSHAQIPCTTCHTQMTPTVAIPTTAQCQQCHGNFAQLAQKTAKLNPRFNPHDSHMGAVDCTTCHAMHKQSNLMCNDCHGFTGNGTEMK